MAVGWVGLLSIARQYDIRDEETKEGICDAGIPSPTHSVLFSYHFLASPRHGHDDDDDYRKSSGWIPIVIHIMHISPSQSIHNNETVVHLLFYVVEDEVDENQSSLLTGCALVGPIMSYSTISPTKPIYMEKEQDKGNP